MSEFLNLFVLDNNLFRFFRGKKGKIFKLLIFEIDMARKISGGKYRQHRKKKKHEIPRMPRMVKLGEVKKKVIISRGGNGKIVLLATNKAAVLDKKSNKYKVVKIKAVLEIHANRYLKNVLLKGTVIDTELGKAKIINRPGQEGDVKAVLI